MIDEELKIWAAGLFDGEGSALIEVTGKNSFSIVVAVANSEDRATAPIMEVWGGHYRADRDLSRIWPYSTKTDYSVYFDHGEARRFLADIYPYLRVRRREALVVLKALCKLPKQKIGTTGKKRVPQGSTKILKPFYEELRNLHNNG